MYFEVIFDAHDKKMCCCVFGTCNDFQDMLDIVAIYKNTCSVFGTCDSTILSYFDQTIQKILT